MILRWLYYPVLLEALVCVKAECRSVSADCETIDVNYFKLYLSNDGRFGEYLCYYEM